MFFPSSRQAKTFRLALETMSLDKEASHSNPRRACFRCLEMYSAGCRPFVSDAIALNVAMKNQGNGRSSWNAFAMKFARAHHISLRKSSVLDGRNRAAVVRPWPRTPQRQLPPRSLCLPSALARNQLYIHFFSLSRVLNVCAQLLSVAITPSSF